MKKIIVLMLLSFQSLASDLIFKHGFENTVSLSGTALGVVSSGLRLQLTVGAYTESIDIISDGVFVFEFDLLTGYEWSVKVIALPNDPQQQNCELSNNSGTIGTAGYSGISISCNSTAWNWDEMNWNQGGWN